MLDPAAGTGGFLVEAYKHLEAQAQTVEDRDTLQRRSIYGGEAKPLPYLLAQMNLLLHGMEYPQIDPGNSLRFPLREIGDRDRVDVILTNPPFGGEEERGILGNFPEDKQAAETTLLFLQLIMRKLRRAPHGGRAGVVVPNGTLFGDGVCARIKEELLTQFNLHTIVRLPNGVFAPYTSIPTNLLFFDRTGPTEAIWYYELPLPEGRKQYTKTGPLGYETFEECLAWWRDRQENAHAWRVSARDVLKVRRGRGPGLGQPGRQEPQRRGRPGAPAAGAVGGEHFAEGAADRWRSWRRSNEFWRGGAMSLPWRFGTSREVLRQRKEFITDRRSCVVQKYRACSWMRKVLCCVTIVQGAEIKTTEQQACSRRRVPGR